MNDGYGSQPPPFPNDRWDRPRKDGCGPRGGKRRYRAGRYNADDFAEEYLGKPRDMSWSDYLGLGSLGGPRRRNRDAGWDRDWSGGPGETGMGSGGRDADRPGADRMGAGMAAGAASQRPAHSSPSGASPSGAPPSGPSRSGTEDAGMPRMDPFYRSPNPNRLFRNTAEGKIGGVCAGIADYTNTDSWIIRLGFIAGFFMFTPVFLFGYPLLWWILKPRPQQLFESSDEEKFWRSVTTRPEQTLAGLRAKFRTLDRQLSSIEGYVTSQEYALNRQFKDLEKR